MNDTLCETTTQRLPWLLNGSLEETERQALVAHLRDCAACRRELAETCAAYEVYGAHPPVAALVGYAAGPQRTIDVGDDGAISRQRVEEHLRDCAACREELEMVAASRRALELDGGSVASADAAPQSAGAVPAVLPFAHPSERAGRAVTGSNWRSLALAASLLLAIVAAGGWFATARRSAAQQAELARLVAAQPATASPAGSAVPGETTPAGGPGASGGPGAQLDALERAVAAAQTEVAATREQVVALEAESSALEARWHQVLAASPQVIVVAETMVRRGGERVHPIRVQGGAPLAVLSIYPALVGFETTGAPVGYAITGPGGRQIASGTIGELHEDAVGNYLSLLLTPAQLPAGELTLTLSPAGKEPVHLPLLVTR